MGVSEVGFWNTCEWRYGGIKKIFVIGKYYFLLVLIKKSLSTFEWLNLLKIMSSIIHKLQIFLDFQITHILIL